ncbi:hypothetical protein [Rhizomonospora bruguierae]|uniref:hypothetical protein n=1 Tax=Rhizomonospora bruguierae TaxID=1581705 RepID=UPI001BCEC3FB|nr:hypothetical protein [Micromonospora sp. NBRC 107566]
MGELADRLDRMTVRASTRDRSVSARLGGLSEIGLELTAGYYHRASEPDLERKLAGAVVENTSQRAAYRARVLFDYLDARGRSVAYPQARERIVEVPVIPPGARIPVGTWSYVREDGIRTHPTITTLKVTFGQVRWVATTEVPTGITATTQTITRRPEGSLSAMLTYTRQSTSCRTLVPRGGSAWCSGTRPDPITPDDPVN